MLTYRTGAAGSPSAGGAMADHLLEQTLPADKAELTSEPFRHLRVRRRRAGLVIDDPEAAVGQAVDEPVGGRRGVERRSGGRRCGSGA